MIELYRMETVEDKTNEGFVHVKLFVSGRDGGWDNSLKDYCHFSGICSPERADAILAALNASAPARLEAAE